MYEHIMNPYYHHTTTRHNTREDEAEAEKEEDDNDILPSTLNDETVTASSDVVVPILQQQQQQQQLLRPQHQQHQKEDDDNDNDDIDTCTIVPQSNNIQQASCVVPKFLQYVLLQYQEEKKKKKILSFQCNKNDSSNSCSTDDTLNTLNNNNKDSCHPTTTTTINDTNNVSISYQYLLQSYIPSMLLQFVKSDDWSSIHNDHNTTITTSTTNSTNTNTVNYARTVSGFMDDIYFLLYFIEYVSLLSKNPSTDTKYNNNNINNDNSHHQQQDEGEELREEERDSISATTTAADDVDNAINDSTGSILSDLYNYRELLQQVFIQIIGIIAMMASSFSSSSQDNNKNNNNIPHDNSSNDKIMISYHYYGIIRRTIQSLQVVMDQLLSISTKNITTVDTTTTNLNITINHHPMTNDMDDVKKMIEYIIPIQYQFINIDSEIKSTDNNNNNIVLECVFYFGKLRICNNILLKNIIDTNCTAIHPIETILYLIEDIIFNVLPITIVSIRRYNTILSEQKLYQLDDDYKENIQPQSQRPQRPIIIDGNDILLPPITTGNLVVFDTMDSITKSLLLVEECMIRSIMTCNSKNSSSDNDNDNERPIIWTLDRYYNLLLYWLSSPCNLDGNDNGGTNYQSTPNTTSFTWIIIHMLSQYISTTILSMCCNESEFTGNSNKVNQQEHEYHHHHHPLLTLMVQLLWDDRTVTTLRRNTANVFIRLLTHTQTPSSSVSTSTNVQNKNNNISLMVGQIILTSIMDNFTSISFKYNHDVKIIIDVLSFIPNTCFISFSHIGKADILQGVQHCITNITQLTAMTRDTIQNVSLYIWLLLLDWTATNLLYDMVVMTTLHQLQAEKEQSSLKGTTSLSSNTSLLAYSVMRFVRTQYCSGTNEMMDLGSIDRIHRTVLLVNELINDLCGLDYFQDCKTSAIPNEQNMDKFLTNIDDDLLPTLMIEVVDVLGVIGNICLFDCEFVQYEEETQKILLRVAECFHKLLSLSFCWSIRLHTVTALVRFASMVPLQHKSILPQCVPATMQKLLHCRLQQKIFLDSTNDCKLNNNILQTMENQSIECFFVSVQKSTKMDRYKFGINPNHYDSNTSEESCMHQSSLSYTKILKGSYYMTMPTQEGRNAMVIFPPGPDSIHDIRTLMNIDNEDDDNSNHHDDMNSSDIMCWLKENNVQEIQNEIIIPLNQ